MCSPSNGYSSRRIRNLAEATCHQFLTVTETPGNHKSLALLAEYIDLGLKALPETVVIRAHGKPAIGLLVEIQTSADLDNPSVVMTVRSNCGGKGKNRSYSVE